jgi:hypothetical protein
MGLPSSLFNFQVTLAESKVAQAVEPPGKTPGTGNPQTSSVVVKARAGNIGLLFVGVAGVSETTGLELEKGESIALDINGIGNLFFVGANAGDKLCVLGVGP